MKIEKQKIDNLLILCEFNVALMLTCD